MNFKDAIEANEYNETTFTDNGMLQHKTTSSDAVDLFFRIGSLRAGVKRKDQIPDVWPQFSKVFSQNVDLAVRMLLWARDVRGGAGERLTFRRILLELEKQSPALIYKLLPLIPEIGRWDDILIFQTENIKRAAFDQFGWAVNNGDGLAAKWAPRINSRRPEVVKLARQLASQWKMSDRDYRKFIVERTNVVEQQMSAKKWNEINYEHVPSLASIRYVKAFGKHDPIGYGKFQEKLEKGEAKVNAGAVYPHTLTHRSMTENSVTLDAMWDALPDYTNGANILPVIDISESMNHGRIENSPLNIAVALGLYLAMKNNGPMKDYFLTFHSHPEFVKTSGPIGARIRQVLGSHKGYNTDVMAALDKVLAVAKAGNVAPEDMPKSLLFLSDMQFDQANNGGMFMDNVRDKYEAAGYQTPGIVFWNLDSRLKGAHAKFDSKGVAMVSGFSPSILPTVMGDLATKTPYDAMMDILSSSRYDWNK